MVIYSPLIKGLIEFMEKKQEERKKAIREMLKTIIAPGSRDVFVSIAGLTTSLMTLSLAYKGTNLVRIAPTQASLCALWISDYIYNALYPKVNSNYINAQMEQIFSNTKDLYTKMQADDIVIIYNVFCRLLKNGVFSQTDSFEYGTRRKNIGNHFDIDVLIGEGECGNASAFLTKLLNYLGYTSCIWAVAAYENKKDWVKRMLSLSGQIETMTGNHAIVFAIDKNVGYVFDPVWVDNGLWIPMQDRKLQLLDGNENNEAFLTVPNIILSPNTMATTKIGKPNFSIKNQTLQALRNNPITRDDYMEKFAIAQQLCEKHYDEIEKLRQENKEPIDKVCEATKDIGLRLQRFLPFVR